MKKLTRAYILLLCIILPNASMFAVEMKHAAEINGSWSMYVRNDKPLGTSIAIYDFRQDCSYRITVVPLPREARVVTEKDTASVPVPAIIYEGKYEFENGVLSLIESKGDGGHTKVYAAAVQNDLLVLRSQENGGETFILVKAQRSKSGPSK